MARPRFSRREVLAWLAATVLLPNLSRSEEPAAGNLVAEDPKGEKNVPWLAEVQEPPGVLPSDAPELSPLLVDPAGQKIKSLDAWLQRREEIRRWWLNFLGPLPGDRKAPPQLTVAAEDRPQGVIRQLVTYEIEPNISTEAYLLRPEYQRVAGKAVKRPGVVVFHQTIDNSIRVPAGFEGFPEHSFALELARRGCVTFCPRNYLWPTTAKIMPDAEAKRYAERHPGSKGMAKMLSDGMVALDILAGQPDVDPRQLGSIGHSLGGKETLYLAALDERVRATVSCEGGIGTRFTNWDALWFLGPEIRQPTFTHEHHELLALAAPRPFLLVGGDSADGAQSWPFIAAALPVYQLYADAGMPSGRPRLGLLNHHRGHPVHPTAAVRMNEWMTTYLSEE
jgi:dienelactone hydrolase